MSEQISRAVQILRSGGLVAFPTETVYGLGADATCASAVQRIFAAKGRPGTNPLIIHVADAEMARRYAALWPDQAAHLAQRFWPGPLTLVVPKASCIVAEATAGRNTVGLRAPDHPLALQLLRAFAGPLAGPSANRSNRVSPTTAQHVRQELGPQVDLILDGGPCRVGIESTVLDLSGPSPRILRPGGVSRQQIEAVIGPVQVFSGSVKVSEAAASPGQQSVHYSPQTTAYRFAFAQRQQAARWLAARPLQAAAVVVIGACSPDDPLRRSLSQYQQVVEMPTAAEAYARHLYAMLHAIDERHLTAIWVEQPPDEPQWAAVRDRLSRATRPGPE